jgi:hypothetical protein
MAVSVQIEEPLIHPDLPVADRAIYDSADALIRAYGDDAGPEAAARADRSRDLGNIRHFCRWRQVERLILLIASDEAVGTRH